MTRNPVLAQAIAVTMLQEQRDKLLRQLENARVRRESKAIGRITRQLKGVTRRLMEAEVGR